MSSICWLHPRQHPEKLGFRLTDRSDFGVVENLEVWPRAFFANQVVLADSNDQFINHLMKDGKQPFIALTREEIEKQPGLQKLEATKPGVFWRRQTIGCCPIQRSLIFTRPPQAWFA